jgi:hypothetical protein
MGPLTSGGGEAIADHDYQKTLFSAGEKLQTKCNGQCEGIVVFNLNQSLSSLQKSKNRFNWVWNSGSQNVNSVLPGDNMNIG